MFRSDNDGLNWIVVNNAFTGKPVNSFSRFNTSIFSCSSESGILLYKDAASGWTALNDGYADTSMNTVIVSGGYAYAGSSNHGVWKRPLSQIFSLSVDPDTLFLSQFSGSSDSLFIHTGVSWSIICTLPEWLTCEPRSGNGDGYVVFTILKPNLSAFKKYVSFFLYSPYLATITFVVVQKEKTAGINEADQGLIRVYPVPSSGKVRIESVQHVKCMTIYNAYGKVVYEISTPEPDFQLDLSGEGPGVYFLRIEGEKWFVIKKIMIQNK